MIDTSCLSLKALGDDLGPDDLAQLLLDRQALINEAITNNDPDALKTIMNIDIENLSTLRKMLAKRKETLGNLSKLAQYIA